MEPQAGHPVQTDVPEHQKSRSPSCRVMDGVDGERAQKVAAALNDTHVVYESKGPVAVFVNDRCRASFPDHSVGTVCKVLWVLNFVHVGGRGEAEVFFGDCIYLTDQE